MKLQENTKYIFYILIFIVFVIIRANYLIHENGIINIEFKALAISSCSFPFGILKETILKDYFLPLYYFLIHYFFIFTKSIGFLKVINCLIALVNIFFIIQIGKQILNKNLGYLLGIFFAINHFFLYYTSLIAPYCLYFLTGTILIKAILNFIKKPNKKSSNFLIFSNILFLLTNNLGFLYVIPELLLLYLFFEKRSFIKKRVIKTSIYSFITLLLTFPLIIVQYYNWTNVIIPNNYNGIGLNLNSLYLILNEYISPYLSFNTPEIQTNSVLGMIFSFFVNPDIKNINSIKILITLFYSSILPIIMLVFYMIKAYKKNYKLKFIFLIAILNFLLTAIFMLYEIIDTNPVYLTQLFITSLILLGYGICKIKDRFFRYLIIFCLITIQFINPEVNAFNITVNKSYPTINVLDSFIEEYNIKDDDYIIMPYMAQYANLYYKDLTFFDFDYSMLQKNNKKSIIRNLSNKNTTTINKKNINRLIRDYLTEQKLNSYLTKYFIDKSTDKLNNRVIIFIDKLNSKPVSDISIIKSSNIDNYTTRLRKIDYKYNKIPQNKTKILYDAIKSKTLYNFIELADSNFMLESIVQYKKVDNEYYKTKKNSIDIYSALNSIESDYVFLVFKIYR